MKKGWVVLNVLCIGIVCMMMTSCTGIFQQKKLESSGQCGDQLNWTYDQKKKTLTISGSGAMNAPKFYWNEYEIQTLVLEEGITSISQSAFYGHSGLRGELKLPSTLETIEEFAFYDCGNLEGNLIIPENVKRIGDYAFRGCKKNEW